MTARERRIDKCIAAGVPYCELCGRPLTAGMEHYLYMADNPWRVSSEPFTGAVAVAYGPECIKEALYIYHV